MDGKNESCYDALRHELEGRDDLDAGLVLATAEFCEASGAVEPFEEGEGAAGWVEARAVRIANERFRRSLKDARLLKGGPMTPEEAEALEEAIYNGARANLSRVPTGALYAALRVRPGVQHVHLHPGSYAQLNLAGTTDVLLVAPWVSS